MRWTSFPIQLPNPITFHVNNSYPIISSINDLTLKFRCKNRCKDLDKCKPGSKKCPADIHKTSNGNPGIPSMLLAQNECRVRFNWCRDSQLFQYFKTMVSSIKLSVILLSECATSRRLTLSTFLAFLPVVVYWFL